MTRYEFLVLLHIVAVIIWLGAAFTIDLLFLRAERTRDPAELGRVGELQDWLVPRLFIPAAFATVILGIIVAWDGPWSFGSLWILLGLAGWAASFLTGILFLKPQAEQIPEIIGRYGPTSIEARRHGKRLLVVARVQLLTLFLVVVVMVSKPTGDDVWTLVVLAAILVAAAAAAFASVRRMDAGEPATPATE